MVDEKPDKDLDYAGALVLAMKKEKAAFRLYTDLAAQAQDFGQRRPAEKIVEIRSVVGCRA